MTAYSDRRVLTRRALLAATCAGATLAYAGRTSAMGAAPNKLVVIIARGAMDGLSVTVPYADRDYAEMRGGLAIPPPDQDGGALDLAEGFGLHPALKTLHMLHGRGQMRFAPAVALPVRIRSHFDAQDILESGGGAEAAQPSGGWLNRALTATGAAPAGLSIGAQIPIILRGDALVSSWAPGGQVRGDDRIVASLQDLYADDPLLARNLAQGLATEAKAIMSGDGAPVQRNDARRLGGAVAGLMLGESGADVVAVSLDGWDTHAGQRTQLQTRLNRLDQLISGLHEGLGEAWTRTVVIIATEFGRTVRVNGTQGTDHGTASSLLLAGGALKTGGLIGDWPTLAPGKLYENRDLAPTLDIRSIFKGVLRDHLGADRAALDTRVFPESAFSAPPADDLIAISPNLTPLS